MALLLDSIFALVSFGHLTVDFLSGQRYVLLTYMIEQIGLSNTVLGFVSMFYTLMASLIQPLFGVLTDRIGPRWLIVCAMIWLGVFYGLGTSVPGVAGLVLFILASVGSAAFHPAATMLSTERGLTRFSGRETTATALFFLFGQAGQFFGPLIGGIFLQNGGVSALSFMSLFALPIALSAFVRLKFSSSPEVVITANPQANLVKQTSIYALIALALVAAFQSWSQQNMVTFLPKYLSDLGIQPGIYGALASLFMGGSAIGNLIGGHWADRYGKRKVAATVLTLGSLPILLVPLVGWSLWLYILIPVAGFLTGAIFSILIVLAQRIMPGGKATASGMILGFLFSSGAVGTMVSGYIADLWGFPPVFGMTGIMLLIAVPIALTLEER